MAHLVEEFLAFYVPARFTGMLSRAKVAAEEPLRINTCSLVHSDVMRLRRNLLKDTGIPLFKINGHHNWYSETHRFTRDGTVGPYRATMYSALR